MSKIIIFPTNRKVREYYLKLENSLTFDKILCVEDFFLNLLYEPSNKIKASEYESSIIMHIACEKTHKSKELKINENFFTFLKNKEYLFSFFKELSLERKKISDLMCRDYYAQYDEHLEILDELLKNYLALLEEKGLYDDISLPLSYDIDYKFLDAYDEICFELGGFLSTFELEVLEKISKHKKLIISFDTSKFNISYLQELSFLKNCELKISYHYEVDFFDKKILIKEKIKENNLQIKCQAFEFRSLQAVFVLDEISSFIKDGIAAKNIAVITPDESFCEFLRLYDYNNTLNYASGKNIKETLFYRKLKTLIQALEAEFIFDDDKTYFETKNKIFDIHNSSLKYLNLEEFSLFKSKFREKFEYDFFENFINKLLEDENTELKNFIEIELNLIRSFLQDEHFKKLSLKELMHLFLSKISSINLSLLGGSDVTVMGILESRSMEYEAVIVLDFNDDFIPKRSINELFLNNEIRSKSGLISYDRRENLQRFYYENLFKKAKKVSISFVENEERIRSRFLDELGLKSEYGQKNTQSYLNAFKKYGAFHPDLKPLQAPILKHNIFENPLSHSRLNSFLYHKRTYYYRYIRNLQEARALNPKSLNTQFGNFIHEMLNIYYSKQKNAFVLSEFSSLLDEKIQDGICKLELELFKLKLRTFELNENKHFREGFKVLFIEKELQKSICLNKDEKKYEIKLQGRIDRIDANKDEKCIIDYKSGKIEKDSYQLAFYKALYDENATAFYYDLKDSMSFKEEDSKNLQALKELFLSLLDDIDKEICFENETNKSCPYKSIYEKNLK